MLTMPSDNKFLSCASRLIVLSGVIPFTLLLLLGHASPAKAAVTETQVAVATATNLKAIGKPPISPARELKTGVGVFFSEKVSTNQVGRAQLLFEDGTALTVGPTSDLVIDEYVYDPKAGTGAMTVSISKGFFRLVGGKISKKTPIKFLAPNATVGVRGGIVLLELSEDGALTADLLYGDELTVTSGGKTQRTTQAGRFISVMGANAIPLPSQHRSSIDLTRLVGAFERKPVTQSAADNLLTATEKKQQTAEAREKSKAEVVAAKEAVQEAREDKKAAQKVAKEKQAQRQQVGQDKNAAKLDKKTSGKALRAAEARVDAAKGIAGPEGKVALKAAEKALRQARQVRRSDQSNLKTALRERTAATQAKKEARQDLRERTTALRTARDNKAAAKKQLRVTRKEDRIARQELRAATKRIRVLGRTSIDDSDTGTSLVTANTIGSGKQLSSTVQEGQSSTKGDSGTDAPISVTIDPITGEASIRCGSTGDCDSVIEVGSSKGSTTVLIITKRTKAEKKEAKAEKQEAKAEKQEAKAEKQEAKAEKKEAKKAKKEKKAAKKEKKAAKKEKKAEKKEAKSESEECDSEVSTCETRLPAGVVALWTWSADGGARIETTVSGRPTGSLPKLTRRPCTACRFLAWGRETLAGGTADTSRIRYWLAGAAATTAELAAAADKSATYSGAMLGGVLRAGSIVERRGSFDARVRFGTTHYQVNAFDASFDGRRFRGASARTGNAAPFNVKTTSASWAHDTEKTHTLRASGYFFGHGASAGDSPPEMGGHFRITGDRYQAGGVFVGRKR